MFWAQKKSVPFIPGFKLEGLRVYMRYARAQDWMEWASVRRQNESLLKLYEPTWSEDCLTLEFFERRIARQQRDREDDYADSFLIFSKQDQLIGGMNINHICRGAAQNAALGYWLAQEHQGQGLMTEAMNLTIAYCFKNLNLHRIHAACLVHNERSIKLLRRCGFLEDGFAAKYLKINGSWQDHVLFGLPYEHWKKD